MIYLDHNATCPPDPRVLQAMRAEAEQFWANPTSQHDLGQRSRRRLHQLSDQIARILGASPQDQLVFTSGGTEANNLALFGLSGQPPGRIIISSIEHPSVTQAAAELSRRGFDVQQLKTKSNGQVDVDALPQLMTPDTRLISVMLANNETGVRQPIERVVQIAADNHVPVHTDAVQIVGKLPVQFSNLKVAALTACAHKLHGPVGIGLLILRQGVRLRPILHGGAQQLTLRPGTESVPLVAGFTKALELWHREAAERIDKMGKLRNLFEHELRRAIPGVVVVGGGAERVPHTSCIAFPGHDRQLLLLRLDRAGIACSTGSACASGSSEPSPVLLAMGCPSEVVTGALRFSIGAFTTEGEIDRAIRAILDVLRS